MMMMTHNFALPRTQKLETWD